MENLTNIIIAILAIGLVLTSGILAFNMKSTTILTDASKVNEKNIISTSGNSKLTVSPDQAEIYFRVQTDGKIAIEAQDGNRRASNTVIDALKAKGLDNKNIETTQYYIQKKYKWNPQTGDSEVTGYEVVHVIKAMTSEVDNVGSLVDVGVNAGANGIDNIAFTLSDSKNEEIRAEALSAAGELAKSKAKILASSVGASLGKVVSVTESSYNFSPYNYAPRAMAGAESAMKVDTSEIQPQTLEITATVSVVYEIEQ